MIKQKWLLLSVLGTCIGIKGMSQADPFAQLKNLPVQTPQAASLAKYVEYPVSYVNGLPEVSIPVYQIRSGDISVPVTLGYHSAGIKASEEASWVGLGFSLAAGGVISHDVKGVDDDKGQYYFNQYFQNSDGDTYHESNMDQFVVGTAPLVDVNGQPVDQNVLFGNLAPGNGIADGEPDLYMYNFGNYSGKFTWVNSQLVDLSHNNINFIRAGNAITAITPDGFTYLFDKTEKSFGGSFSTTTAYYLTRIQSPKGKTVTFQYKSFYDLYTAGNWQSLYEGNPFTNGDYVAQLPTLFQNVTNIEFASGVAYGGVQPNTPPNTNFIYSPYNQVDYLDKIVFDNGYMQFVQGPRSDLYGARLDQVKVFRSDNSLVKNIIFNYDYFTGNSDDGFFDPYYLNYTGYRFPYPLNYRKKRLKLLSVQEDDGAYRFDYHEGSGGYTLPYKSTFAQDYWGYYNGQSTNTTLVPDFRRYSQNTTLTPFLSGYVGANRDQDEAHTKEGVLEKITFPTGGTTQFDYELNRYTNFSSEQQVVYQPVSVSVTDIGTGTQQQFFTLTQDTYVTINGVLFCNNGPDLSAPNDCVCFVSPDCYTAGGTTNGLYEFIMQVDPVTHAELSGGYLNQWDKTTPIVQSTGGLFTVNNQLLHAGTYVVTVNYPDNKAPGILGQRMASLNVNYFAVASLPPITEKQCGGLRTKTITNFEPVRNQTTTRNFTYSGGILMHYPVFYHRSVEYFDMIDREHIGLSVTVSTAHSVWYLHSLYSNPVFPYSFSANGSIIGYPKVTETISDGSNGKTEYYFKVVPDKFLNLFGGDDPGTPSTAYLDNGFLQKTIVYDKNNTVLNETDNTQEIVLTKTYWPFKYSTHYSNQTTEDGVPGPVVIPTDNIVFGNNTYFSFYPIQVGKVLKQSSAEIDYANGQALTTSRTFQYNDNGLLKQEKIISSDGSEVASNYTYASDYTGVTSGWQKDMRDKNIIGVPLEVLATRNSLVTGGSYTTFNTHDNIITPNQVYKVATAVPQSIASTAPNGTIPSQFELEGTVDYDANGNLQNAQASNNTYTSWLWGYTNALPIANAAGAQQKDIFYTSFEDADGNSTDGDSKTGKKSKTDGYQKTLSNLTNGNYSLTYWLKSGGSWALQTATVPVTGGTYSIAISGQVDELRFCPQYAQMISYTYDPLVGVTSQNDANNRITYYEYDAFQRLMHVKDKDQNIVKKYDYYYQVPVNSLPGWKPDGNTRCKPCSQNPAYSVNIQQIEIKDFNPYSATYNQTQWMDQGPSATCGSPANWQNTSTAVRCKTVNSVNTSEQEQEQQDINPCSATYNQTQWVVVATNCSSCPTPANWQNTTTAVHCVVDANSSNTGDQEQEQNDINSCSATYNQTRWVNIGANTTACPIPCNNYTNCSGSNHHCVNGVCETGHLIVLGKQYSNPVCVTIYGYVFTDGTVQYDHTEYVNGPCN